MILYDFDGRCHASLRHNKIQTLDSNRMRARDDKLSLSAVASNKLAYTHDPGNRFA
jgi:hypothetical protein